MIAIFIVGFAVGLVLGLGRFKVLTLPPVILLLGAGGVAKGIATGLHPFAIAFDLAAAIVTPQVGYLVSFVGAAYIVAGYLRLRAKRRLPVLLKAMPSVIGQELRTSFKLPQELPREMVALLAQICIRESSPSKHGRPERSHDVSR